MQINVYVVLDFTVRDFTACKINVWLQADCDHLLLGIKCLLFTDARDCRDACIESRGHHRLFWFLIRPFCTPYSTSASAIWWDIWSRTHKQSTLTGSSFSCHCIISSHRNCRQTWKLAEWRLIMLLL